MTFRQRDISNLHTQHKILVVDPDPAMIELIRSNFSREGFTIVGCTNADELYSMDLSEFRMMIIDLSINDGTGLNIIEQLKHTDAADPIPIIACSVNQSPAQVISALNAGADDYMLKPYPLRELLARIRSVLRRS